MASFDVRARIMELLQEKGLSAAQFAKMLGYNRRTVAYWKQHERAFNADTLPDVCEALKMTPNQFFGISDSAPEDKDSIVAELSRARQLDESTLRQRLEQLRKEQLILELALLSKQQRDR